jgi:thioredoxin 1
MIEFTQSNFTNEVEQPTAGCVLVDFWATWCVPCLKIAPVLEELAQKYNGKMKFGKVNVENVPQIAQKYGVRSIPTLLLFKNGKIMTQIIGAQSKKNIEEKILEMI